MKIYLASICWLSCLLLASTEPAIAQQSEPNFPYQALVLADQTTVHSGPASVHYATDELKLDAVVEVYRHDPGGWCAIKPPSGSFSLLPESAVEKESDTIGLIKEDGIQAWVGTRLGSVEKPLWQIKLRKNEVVEILGEVSWPNPEGHSTTWYQIAPPAGEFRWIRISDIKLPKNATDLPDLIDANSNGFASQIRTDIGNDELSRNSAQVGFQETDPTFDDSLDPPSLKNETVNRGWRKATSAIRIADRRIETGPVKPFKIPAIESPARSSTSDNEVFERPRDIDRGGLVRNDSMNVSSLDVSTFEPLKNTVPPIAGPVSERIRLLENSLTTEMLKSPDEWKLESILRQATSISNSTNHANERQHANRLVEKIRNCTTIQSRFESAYTKKSSVDDSLRGVVGTGIDDQVQYGTTYDAHGWLNKLVRGKGSRQPTYVLENEDGKIIYHIAPSPGLNLNRYLKSKVGVIGRRGFHRELQMDHLTADRVVVLDQVRR